MNYELFPRRNSFLTGAAVVMLLALGLAPIHAQAPNKTNDPRSGSQPSAATVEQELVRIETGFFEAWKMNDQAFFREHMAENGVFWGEDGTLSRDQQLAALQSAVKNCTVDGFGLSDFGALPLASGAYLLTYKAQQYAVCNGEKLPVHINGSSIYVLKAGRWQAIYRAQVAFRNQR